jgi:flagellar biosynthesis/type III secretory pathway protein FliH
VGQQRTAALQQQGRMAQYRFQQQYSEHVRQQDIRLQNERHDYNNDPYFYTAPSYRYNRGGNYYETNEYGANLLREAVNYGYEEGFRAGQADRQDGWASNYQDSFAYQDANYGYDGYYVAQDDYNYYFREGFRRGYEDGYNGRYQYGRYSDGKYTILGGILGSILDLQSLP